MTTGRRPRATATSHRPSSILTLTLAVAVAATLTCTLPVAPAHASWRARADSLFAEGDRSFDGRDYAAAETLYGAAVETIESNTVPVVGSYFAQLDTRARFMMARSQEHLEKWAPALRNYVLCLAEMGELEDLLRVRMAACHAGAGDFELGMQELRAVIDDGVDGPFDLEATHQLATYYERTDDHDMALQWHRLYLAQARSYDERALATYRMGRAYERRGDEKAAGRSYAKTVDDFPRSRHAYDALRDGREISRAFTDRYHQGLVLYNRSRYEESAEFFTYYIRHDREQEHAHEANYFLGRSHQRLGNFRTAARRYEDAIAFGPDAEYHDLAWSKLAYCRRASGKLERSLETYERFVIEHPERDAAPDLLWEKARLLEEKQRWEEAAAEFRRIAGAYATSAVGPDALFRAGLCLYKMEDYEQAAALFASISVGTEGEEAARAFFWAGKCGEMLSGGEDASAAFREALEAAPDSYYAARARARLREKGLDASPAGGAARGATGAARARENPGRPARPALWGGEGLEFAAWLAEWHDEVYVPAGRTALRQRIYGERSFKRADALLALHMREAALAELSNLVEDVGRDPRVLDLLVEYCERVGLHKRGILLAERILAISPADGLSEAPIYLRKRICPTHFSDVVERECAQRGIDPNMEFSLIRQESLFEPAAVSWVGARGLSQIMPYTGRWLARRLGHRPFNVVELFDPETNIRFGTEYLAIQLEEFDGDVMRALAAYNGGPDASERWWDYSGGRDTDVFVEDIGYAQTVDYVRRVFLYSEVYRDLYGPSRR